MYVYYIVMLISSVGWEGGTLGYPLIGVLLTTASCQLLLVVHVIFLYPCIQCGMKFIHVHVVVYTCTCICTPVYVHVHAHKVHVHVCIHLYMYVNKVLISYCSHS